MRRFIIGLIFSHCLSYGQYFSKLTDLHTPVFTRRFTLQYRGEEPSVFSSSNATKAMLGDEEQYVTSLFSKAYELKSKDLSITSYGDFIWLNRVLQDTAFWKSLDFKEDNKKLTNKIDSYFEKRSYKDTLFSNLDYSSYLYNHHPIDYIFSSIFQSSVRLYGAAIIKFRPDDRIIDLGYLNYYLLKNTWKQGPDAGEFITPGYIRSSNISGYFIAKKASIPDRSKIITPWTETFKQARNKPLLYLHKTKIQNENIVVLYDLTDDINNGCITSFKNSIYNCTFLYPTRSYSYIKNFPVNGFFGFDREIEVPTSRAKAFGFFQRCDCDGECKNLNLDYLNTPISDNNIPTDIEGHGNIIKQINKSVFHIENKCQKVIWHPLKR